MQQRRLLWIVVLTWLVFLSLPQPAYAYIDPGTTGNIFAMFAPFIALFLVFLGFLTRPFKRFVAFIITKLRGGTKAESLETNEQPIPSDLPDDNNGENTSEEPKS